jgi:NADPH:quinone reductase-like Zn-dependent oxidoreductase
MKAIVFDRYGEPDLLRVAEVEKPSPRDHEVLVKVRTAGVNPADYQTVRGDVRPITGLFQPKRNRLGYDVAGVVEAVGEKVTRFKPGDFVFGSCSANPLLNSQAVWIFDLGSFADFTLTHEAALALKPEALSFEQAAAVPTAGWVALQGLRNHGQVRAGQSVLISSATGGIGTFAVQIAKLLGAEVTGVCSAKNADLVRSLGADHVVDYAKEDYSTHTGRYDVIFDSVSNHSLFAMERCLKPGGKVVFVGVRRGGPYDPPFWWRIFLTQTLPFVVSNPSRPNADDLNLLGEWVASGKIKPAVAKTYSGLGQVPEAVQFVKDGHAWGKVLVTL